MALHARRGDVHTHVWRHVPNKWYLGLVAAMEETHGGELDMHVFTDTMDRPNDLDAFRTKGVVIHDNCSVLDDWAHMAHADVRVMSNSLFSLVPGLFNEHCVAEGGQSAEKSSWREIQGPALQRKIRAHNCKDVRSGVWTSVMLSRGATAHSCI